MKDLDEVLKQGTSDKLNWLVVKVNSIEHRVETIEENHLTHISEDIHFLKRGLLLLGVVLFTLLTGMNFITVI